MMVECSGQAEVDAAIAAGNIPIVKSGHVHAWGSATVHASGSATVRAWDSATVDAWGSATVHAWDSATVRASDFVAVHKHPDRGYGKPTIAGGVVIEIPSINTFKEWAEFHKLGRDRQQIIVFKAVTKYLCSDHGMAYLIGQKVVANDWSPEPSCGGGLHFSQSPHHATRYHREATRWLACAIPASSVLIGSGIDADKVKAPSCRVLFEVDIDGNRIEQVSA